MPKKTEKPLNNIKVRSIDFQKREICIQFPLPIRPHVTDGVGSVDLTIANAKLLIAEIKESITKIRQASRL